MLLPSSVHIQPSAASLYRREEGGPPPPAAPPPPPSPTPTSTESGQPTPKVLIIVAASILCSVVGIIVIFCIIRFLRARYPNPKFVPTQRGKRIWRAWTPGSSHRYDAVSSPRPRGHTMDSLADNPSTRQTTRNSQQSNAVPDRNTSVRSVITLPAYKPSPSESEQTLGREGERGGIDVVIEFPETVEEVEDRRELEMESLYQIRATRRIEAAAREDRRERRRVARAAGDTATLEQLRREREAARVASAAGGPSDSTSSLAAQVLADNAQRERDRRISSVSYASVGLARHDGSRVRAGSTESERPLLSLDDGGLPNPPFLHNGHTRGRSASSALSISSTLASDHSPSPVRGRGGSVATLDTIHLGGAGGASPNSSTGDVADEGIPREDPPGYEGANWNGSGHAPGEEAPPYTSPVRTRAPPLQSSSGAPQLPVIGDLPAIEVTPHSPTV